ncbi:hypothetical protein HZS_535 [Henneguya salminicola]|nr:hypothetical protein HZS_535 [Henneguya salminicola]
MLRLGREANTEYHRITMWMSPAALSLLRAKNPVLIDGTFAATPSPFSQTVIVMTYDLDTSSFGPCVIYICHSSPKSFCNWTKNGIRSASIVISKWSPSRISYFNHEWMLFPLEAIKLAKINEN